MTAAGFAALMAPLGPFGTAPPMAAGVSGGPHSLALALLAQEFCQACGGSLLALVVDHGLRAESAAEARWTADTLAAQGVAAEIISLDLPRGAAVQERARQARLAAMLAACARHGRPWLLLGQHRMDQAETVLFRALRGSQASGLAGMAAARPAAEAVILRPLLPVAPAALEAVLAVRGLAPLRDPSNADARFARVRLRRALADPDGTGAATAALAEAAAAFARRRAAAEARVAERLALAASLQPEGWARLDAALLGQDAVARQALATLLRLLSGAEHAPPAAAVADLLTRGQGTLAGVQWGGDILAREASACAPPVPAVDDVIWDGRWRLRRPVPQGCWIGALGAAAAAALPRAARRGLPARVLAGLPALREGFGAGAGVAAIPPLGLGWAVTMDLAPAGGPPSGYKTGDKAG